MDQLIYASLSHTHYWYEAGMLKVPASYKAVIQIVSYNITIVLYCDHSSVSKRSPYRGSLVLSCLCYMLHTVPDMNRGLSASEVYYI